MDRIKKIPIVRTDGKLIQVVPNIGHLLTCQLGCCCGRVERGFAPSFRERYHQEWERRKLRNRVHLTHTACLGPCSLANVALLLFDGQSTWFHSLNSEASIVSLYDYIEQMLAINRALPPPPALADHVFQGFVRSAAPEQTHLIKGEGT